MSGFSALSSRAHGKNQFEFFTLQDFHPTTDHLLRLASAMGNAVLGAHREDQLLLFLLGLLRLEVPGDKEARLLRRRP